MLNLTYKEILLVYITSISLLNVHWVCFLISALQRSNVIDKSKSCKYVSHLNPNHISYMNIPCYKTVYISISLSAFTYQLVQFLEIFAISSAPL